MTRIFCCIFLSLFLSAAAVSLSAGALATEIEHGRNGLTRLPLRVRNVGVEPLSCGASLAHWYSQPLGTAASGAELTAELWVKPETGAVVLLNAGLDRMPVERLWCGTVGRSWATRREIPLERRAGTAVAPIILDCRTDDSGTHCNPR